ncbi:MAG: efflux RND transporter permease subunit, partial [Planctomycetota bacterium]
ACLFESIRQPFALLVSVSCALPGVIWFLHLHGDRLDQPAGVGLILLAGIVVNNGIVLIDHVNRHRREGLPLLEALRRGGEERLRPILITALTTLIGLIPMAYGGAQAAGTYYFTLARTIIGGLAVSTLLTLVVLPVIYSFMAGSRLGPDAARESAGS